MANQRIILSITRQGEEVIRTTLLKRMGSTGWYPPPAVLDRLRELAQALETELTWHDDTAVRIGYETDRVEGLDPPIYGQADLPH